MKILIIEDSCSMAQALAEILQRQGHETTWMFGVQSLDPFVGRQKDETLIPVDPSQFDLVFSDGDLVGSNHQGVEVVQHLVRCGVSCVGVSTMPDINEQMVQCGALVGTIKPIMLAALQAGAVTAKGLKTSPASASLKLARLTKTMCKDPQYADAWQAVETRLRQLMKIEFGF